MAEKKSPSKGSPNAKMSKREQPPSQQRPPPDREQVARRAYERFVQRGGQHGRDLEDWVEAEKDLGGSGN